MAARADSVWIRTNHAGAEVTLLEGPAVAAGLVVGTLLSDTVSRRTRRALAAGIATIGVVGAYDDLAGATDTKGLGGHLRALRHGRVTSGAVKIGVIGASGLATAAVLRVDRGSRARHAGTLLDGALIAGSANLLNLLDLRPGRALKAGAAAAVLAAVSRRTRGLAVPVIVTAAAAAPSDLGGRSMLGDCGANALGAALGAMAVAGGSPRTRTVVLGGVVAATLASERVSFSQVIDSTPWLRWLDRVGRPQAG